MSRGVSGFSGAACRRARLAAGLTADQVGVQVGVGEQAVLKWERTQSAPTADHLGLLAAALDVSIGDMLPRRALKQRNLRDLRHFSGLSVQAVIESMAPGVRLSASGLVRLERGVAALKDEVAMVLAKAYAVTVAEVAEADGETKMQRAGNAQQRQRRPR